ncbi:brachyurin-like [Thrips palmi]|uniref:Brachyurin-like n=1 Tax=Thrips palmi TaxID=161013 RepID=A0A6P9ABX7_THRPL|nr:brachyurin-like [Thrips palmi]
MKTPALLALCAVLASAAASQDVAAARQRVPFLKVPGPARTHGGHGLRIFNGDVASRTQFPFQAGIYLDFNAFCGGSLIHKNWVLTAAHCVDGFKTWTVFLGVSNMVAAKEEGREVQVSNAATRHERYNSYEVTNDIGVIQLWREVDLSGDFIKLVQLAPAGVNYAGQKATVSGFGKVADNSQTISPHLQFTSLPVVSTDVCYKYYEAADVSQICLEAKGTSSCKGDSGGPLTVPSGDDDGSVIQIGLTSFGCKDGCTVGCPVGFTRVNYFLDWLSETTGVNFP